MKTKIILIMLMFCSIANAATYYVDAVDGNDAYDGTEAAFTSGTTGPVKTMAVAVALMSAADTLNVADGYYGNVDLTDIVGNDGNEFTITGAANNGSVIESIDIDGCSYLNLNNLYVRKSAGNLSDSVGVYVTDSNHITFTAVNLDAEVYGEGFLDGGYIFTVTCAYINVINCDITRVIRGIDANCDYLVVRGCTLHNMEGSAIKVLVPCNQSLIEYNLIRDRDEAMFISDIHSSAVSMHAANSTIRGNIVYNYAETSGITFYADYLDGRTKFRSIIADVTGTFTVGETVSLSNGKTGILDQAFISGSYWYIYVLNLESTDSFASIETITGQSSGAVALNGLKQEYRPSGGYHDMLIENNLLYNMENLPINISDVGDNCIIRNNTVLYKYVPTKTLWVERYETALSMRFWAGTDRSTFHLYGNILCGRLNFSAEDYRADITEGENIIWSIQLPAFLYATDMTPTSTSKVICNKTNNFNEVNAAYSTDMFDTAGLFFVGEGTGANKYKLDPNSIAVGFADPCTASTIDLLAETRDATPDAGAIEYFDTTLPDAPSSITATHVDAQQIDVAWSNVANESGYRLYRAPDVTGSAGTWALIHTAIADEITYSDTGLTAATKYYYKALAYNENGDSNYTSDVNDTTDAATSPPAPVTGISAVIIPIQLGDMKANTVIYHTWNAYVTGGDIVVYRNNSASGLSGTSGQLNINGISDSRGFNGMADVHSLVINTGYSSFYQPQSEYSIVLKGATYGEDTINCILARFSIENRSTPTISTSTVETQVQTVENKIDDMSVDIDLIPTKEGLAR